MTIEPPTLTPDRLRKLGIVAGVSAAHLVLFAVIGRGEATGPAPPQLPPFDVTLYRPPAPPPPPPPPLEPSPVQGGGAPAAPSRIHLTPQPPAIPPELVAPPVPAAVPDPIVIGVAPVMTRDIAQRVAEIPEEQIVKAQTLGASTWQMILRVVLPQILPRLITTVRLCLGPAWLFLIAAEAIAATGGLGYRIFLVRRYLAMDIILPYVAWITILAYGIDFALRRLSRRVFGWAHGNGAGL